MKARAMMSLVGVELKKLYRDPMNLAVMLAMPTVLTLVFYFALGNLPTWWLEGATHFEFLVPGTMGIAVIYMGMMVAMGLCTYRDVGLLKRLGTTPASATTYLASQIVANMVIGAAQGLVVLLLAVILGFRPQGGLPGILLATLFLAVLSIAAVGFGLLTAAIAKNSSAASGLSMIFILPMMIFGTWLTAFNDTTYAIARFTPNFYVTEPLTRIFHGAALSDGVVWKDFLILSAISLVAAVGGIQLFKKTEFR
jgi:ABC-2 type transport system permease protein